MILNFPDGLPGFENIHRYRFQELDERFALMEADDGSGVKFYLLKVKGLPELEKHYDEMFRPRNRRSEEELYCILIFNKRAGQVMANLQAPLLIDHRRKRGEQIIFDDPSLVNDYVLMQTAC